MQSEIGNIEKHTQLIKHSSDRTRASLTCHVNKKLVSLSREKKTSLIQFCKRINHQLATKLSV